MVNKIEQFLNEKFGTVGATKDEQGIIWFIASDVAKSLKYASTQKVTDKVDDDDKDYRTWLTLGGEQKLVTINEGGLYQVIFSITKKDKERYELARDFKRWITNEVIPTIRVTGAYIEKEREEGVVDKYFYGLSDDLKLLVFKELQSNNEKLQVKAGKWDNFLDTTSTYTFTEVAKMIVTYAKEDGNKTAKLSNQKLTGFLREQEILSKAKSGSSYTNLPNQDYEQYFDVVSIEVNKGGFNKPQTRVKPNGVEFIYGKLIEEYFVN